MWGPWDVFSIVRRLPQRDFTTTHVPILLNNGCTMEDFIISRYLYEYTVPRLDDDHPLT
jgi:hypothetical protein